MGWYFLVVLAGIAVVGLVLGLLALPGGLKKHKGREELPVSAGVVSVSFILLLIFGGSLAIASSNTVEARSYGIVTVLGKYQKTIDSGHDFLNPAAHVEQFSTRRQFLDLDGKDDTQKDNADNSVPVTFKGGSTGRANGEVDWEMLAPSEKDPDTVMNLWKQYGTFNNVTKRLVRGAVSEQLRLISSQYTPETANQGENLVAIKNKVLAQVNVVFAKTGVRVVKLVVTRYNLGEETQSQINKTAAAQQEALREKANTVTQRERAEQDKIRKAQTTRETLISECLDNDRKAIEAGRDRVSCNYYQQNNGAIVAAK